MKKLSLTFLLIASFYTQLFSQELYSSIISTTRLNPGLGVNGTAVIAFDDVNIPSQMVEGSDSIKITKINVGIRRGNNSPATNVNLYYTPYNTASTGVNTYLKIPPVLLKTVSLAARVGSPINTIISLGDSVSALFKIKTDTGNVFKGYQTFFIGISFSNPSTDNGIRLASGPGYNKDSIWIYDVDNVPVTYVQNFSSPVATFYIQVYGNTPRLLPVTISEFKGEKKDKVNRLTWTTLTEQNNKGFAVERSTDGEIFSELAFIPSGTTSGSSASPLTYAYIDATAGETDSYYKLKEVHKDGNITISNIVLIKGIKPTRFSITKVYPNPAKSNLAVLLSAPVNSRINLQVTDLSGKTVVNQPAILVKGDNNLSLSVSQLAPGNYFIKAVCDTGCETAVASFIKR